MEGWADALAHGSYSPVSRGFYPQAASSVPVLAIPIGALELRGSYAAEDRLKDFAREAIPVLLNCFSQGSVGSPTGAGLLGRGKPEQNGLPCNDDVYQWILGLTPLAYELPELLVADSRIGVSRASPHNWLIRFRRNYAALKPVVLPGVFEELVWG